MGRRIGARPGRSLAAVGQLAARVRAWFISISSGSSSDSPLERGWELSMLPSNWSRTESRLTLLFVISCKLATLTRGRELTPATEPNPATHTQFDSTAVPADPTAFSQHLEQLQRAEADDLINLGEEPLFSGQSAAQRAQQHQSASTSAQPIAQQPAAADVLPSEGDTLLATPVVTEVSPRLPPPPTRPTRPATTILIPVLAQSHIDRKYFGH